MKTKAHFDLFVQEKFISIEEENLFLANACDELLDSLFKPSHAGAILDEVRLREYGINKSEPVEWENVITKDATLTEEGWVVTIANAESNKCQTLTAYLELYLLYGGWNIKEVKTITI